MSILELVVYVVIAGLCGATARALAGGTAGGFGVSVMVGFLGALAGSWVARRFALPELLAIDIGGHPFPIIWSILGGGALVALSHVLTRPSGMGRWQLRH